jgi:hypothetical protein
LEQAPPATVNSYDFPKSMKSAEREYIDIFSPFCADSLCPHGNENVASGGKKPAERTRLANHHYFYIYATVHIKHSF